MRVWSVGGLILMGKTRSTRKVACLAVSCFLPQDPHWLGRDRSRASRRWDTTARPSLWHDTYQSADCLFVVYVFPLRDSAIGLFRPQNLCRVLGLESSCLFLDDIDKLMILYHTLSWHVVHACVIFSVILSMCNSLAFISCQDRYIL
jgi:hypothetical protein